MNPIFIKKNHIKPMLVIWVVLMFSAPLMAQTSMISKPLDNYSFQDENPNAKKSKSKRVEYKTYGGLSFNYLKLNSDLYESEAGIGWSLGGSYKRGKFFYWELGGRYNREVFSMKEANNPADTSGYLDNIFAVNNVDVPITFGINFLSFVSRIVGVRAFVSAVPSFILGVNDNDKLITKDDLNSFVFYGQGGVGVDVTFIFLEAGVNYGFQDILKDYSPSNPVQVFINLGVRF